MLSGHGEEPETSTAALVRRLLPEQPAWLAAVGAVGDLGDRGFALPETAGAAKTAVRKLVPLVNAPRRLPDGPVRTALALLVESEEPKAALADPRIAELEAARREWRAGFDAAVRTPPRVGDRVALIRFRSPYQVHPLVATTWAAPPCAPRRHRRQRRLPPRARQLRRPRRRRERPAGALADGAAGRRRRVRARPRRRDRRLARPRHVRSAVAGTRAGRMSGLTQ